MSREVTDTSGGKQKPVPDNIHVTPLFGKPHEESINCWCGPRADAATLDRKKYLSTVWIHEVEQ